MADNINPLSFAQEDDGIAGVISFAIDQKIMEMEKCMLASVVSYDQDSRSISARPLVKMRFSSGDYQDRAIVFDVPLIVYGSSNFSMHFPVSEGDVVLIISCDRDIQNIKDTENRNEVAEPRTARRHKFMDSLAIPLMLRPQQTPSGEESAIVVQNNSGGSYISVSDSYIRAKSSSIILDGDAVINGNLSVNGNVDISGNIDVDGNGDIGAANIGGIPFGSHSHSGVTTGSGSTGGPQ